MYRKLAPHAAKIDTEHRPMQILSSPITTLLQGTAGASPKRRVNGFSKGQKPDTVVAGVARTAWEYVNRSTTESLPSAREERRRYPAFARIHDPEYLPGTLSLYQQ